MKISVRLVQYLGSPRDVVQLAIEAEQAGVDEIWVPHDPFMSNAWTIQTAIAEATERVAVGSLGTNPYTTDPSEIATHLATLDLLSGGRAVLGLGLHTTSMVEWLGLDAADVVERTRASVEIVRALLRGETVVRRGLLYAWSDECALRFEPLRPDPPILVAGFGSDLLRLAGEIGDGAMPMATPPESVGPLVEDVFAGAKAAGRDPSDLEIAACAWLSVSAGGHGTGDPLRPMIATFAPYLEERALESVGLTLEELAPLRTLVEAGRLEQAAAAVTEPMLALALTGTPDAVADRISALRDLGVTHVSLGGPLGPDPHEAIRLLGEHIVPALRGT
ncbi:MAG TPA: LLM class flavin-dependent oxidoreductase [Gaiellaceae bacterium]|nr:LLM class flavin-dependent oxidoreductase [Gaiellaceae bacterium]